MIRVVKAVATAVTDKIAIHCFIETSLKPHYFSVACTGNGVTSERAVDAERRASLKIPPPPGKAGGLIRIDPCRTDINEVSGKGAFQMAVLETTEIGVVGNLHGSQVTIAGKLLIESAAPPAVDTPIHLVLDKDAKVLITISSLLPKVAPDPMTSCYGHVL
jgi:hypothetical protein